MVYWCFQGIQNKNIDHQCSHQLKLDFSCIFRICHFFPKHAPEIYGIVSIWGEIEIKVQTLSPYLQVWHFWLILWDNSEKQLRRCFISFFIVNLDRFTTLQFARSCQLQTLIMHWIIFSLAQVTVNEVLLDYILQNKKYFYNTGHPIYNMGKHDDHQLTPIKSMLLFHAPFYQRIQNWKIALQQIRRAPFFLSPGKSF